MALGTYDCKPTLTDRQMMDFCRNGYLMLEGVVSDEINRRTIDFMKDHDVEEPVEILEEEWFVDAVIKNPEGAGALRCLLGRDFLLPAVMSSHRIQCPGPAQPWHPDAGSISDPRLDYLQVFYYPSGATREMGPTELIPGSHLSQARNAFLGRLRSLKPAVSTASPPGVHRHHRLLDRAPPQPEHGHRRSRQPEVQLLAHHSTPTRLGGESRIQRLLDQERAAPLQCFRRPDVCLALRGGLAAYGRPGLALLHRGRLRLRPDRSAQGPAP